MESNERTPEEMWDAFAEYYRKKLGIEELKAIMGGSEKLRSIFIEANKESNEVSSKNPD